MVIRNHDARQLSCFFSKCRLTIFTSMQKILLLHGAIGSAEQFQPLHRCLSSNFQVYAPNFSGHGGSPMPDEFSIDHFARDVVAFLDEQGLQRVSIFGYSMGGYVAMYLARYVPKRIDKIATLATKWHWDETTAAHEAKMLDSEKIAAKLPAFADTLRARHAPNNWKVVLSKTIDMLRLMGSSNPLRVELLSDIQVPCMLLLGDRDKMVSLEETKTVFDALPNAQMAMLPATPHPLEQVDMELLRFLLERFFEPKRSA